MKALLWPLIALNVLSLMAVIMKAAHCEINDTDSMPMGIYRRVDTRTIHRGEIVAVCLPKPIAVEGLRKRYLVKGMCPGGAIAVLKEVIAVPGDTVNVTKQFLIVNGQQYFAPQAKTDEFGHPVRQFIADGVKQNTKTYWLLGSNDSIHSWDSRYYGGVNRRNIIGVYKPVFTL